uniref:Growth hormone/erythropoietin receptor ligand binding domain-containing protein n=1 Tax=Oncorhynchus tshawytscha TaxID=74940 RepID=A0AAZ3P590_ONCTS
QNTCVQTSLISIEMVRVINLSFYPPGAVAVTNRPHIYYCRSPNMEVFTCWWHPLDNNSESDDNVTYSLTYSLERECPDYVTGGPNSCHFDSGHTSIWTIYCMNVMARTSHGVFSSKDHCLDVADIVETEAPVNLTYTLLNETEEEAGRTAMVSWVYPNPSLIQYGWITLVFELQYRRIAEPNNWKVKGLLREPCLELLDLPVGEYIVRVRCRSRNNGLWSKWSIPVLLCVPVKSTPVGTLNCLMIQLLSTPNLNATSLITTHLKRLPNNTRTRTTVTYRRVHEYT